MGTESIKWLKIMPQFWLSLSTAPVLLGILSEKALTQWLQTAGEASEEILRGDRLPILPFPHSSTPK